MLCMQEVEPYSKKLLEKIKEKETSSRDATIMTW